MSPFTGRAIGLGFAVLWLILGASALPPPWPVAVGAAGLVAIALLGWRAWRMDEPRTGLFRMGRYRIVVAAEFNPGYFPADHGGNPSTFNGRCRRSSATAERRPFMVARC